MLRAVPGCLGAGQTGAAPLEFHYVPKHASWLNMVEIEIGVLAAQCLDRRFAITRPIEPVWRRSSHPRPKRAVAGQNDASGSGRMLVDIVIAAMARLPALAHEPSRNFTSTRESVTAQRASDFRRRLLRSERDFSSPANLPPRRLWPKKRRTGKSPFIPLSWLARY